MSINRVSALIGENMAAFSASALTGLATVSIHMEWIGVGKEIAGLVSMAALAVLNMLILGNWIYHKWKKRNG